MSENNGHREYYQIGRKPPPGWLQPFIMLAYMIVWPIRALSRNLWYGITGKEKPEDRRRRERENM